MSEDDDHDDDGDDDHDDDIIRIKEFTVFA